MRNALLTIATVLTIASGGQTRAGPSFGPTTNLGTIIVYRPCSPIARRVDLKFNLNHGPNRIIPNGTYYRLTVLPGDVILSHDDIVIVDDDPKTVHVEPGQTVYFEYAIAVGFIFEVADDQERAARTVSKLQPLN